MGMILTLKISFIVLLYTTPGVRGHLSIECIPTIADLQGQTESRVYIDNGGETWEQQPEQPYRAAIDYCTTKLGMQEPSINPATRYYKPH